MSFLSFSSTVKFILFWPNTYSVEINVFLYMYLHIYIKYVSLYTRRTIVINMNNLKNDIILNHIDTSDSIHRFLYFIHISNVF